MLKKILLLLAFGQWIAFSSAQNISGNVTHIISNETGQDNFAPFRFGDKIYFSSASKHEQTGRKQTRIFSKNTVDNTVAALSINPTKQGVRAADLTMSSDGAIMFYTICQDETDKQCAIWSRTKEYEGGWSHAVKLPPAVNQRGSTAIQPSIGYDLSINKKVLYFVSDRSGGKGGLDIYQSVIELDGSYGPATPLPFNCKKDDVTPFFQLSEQALFYSTDGLRGAGGLDVFMSKKSKDGQWSKPTNLGNGVNSMHDESYFVYHTVQKKGYFSSNRPLGNSEKNENIYEITPQMSLSLLAYDAQNKARLHGTVTKIYDETNGRKTTLHEDPFLPYWTISLPLGKKYKIVVSKEGYTPLVREISTEGIVFPMAFHEIIYLNTEKSLANEEPDF